MTKSAANLAVDTKVTKLDKVPGRYLLAPSLDLTIYFLAPTQSEWLLVESFAERARAGHALCSANLWDAEGKLVARAAQSMTLRPFKPQRPRST